MDIINLAKDSKMTCIKMEGNSWPDPPSSSFPLNSVGSGHPDSVKTLHVLVGIKPLLFHPTNVHHVHTVVNSYTSLNKLKDV